MLSYEQRDILLNLIPNNFIVNGIEYPAVPIIIEGTTGALDHSNPYIVVSFENEGLIFQKFVTQLYRSYLSSSDGVEVLVEEKGDFRTVDLNFVVFAPDMKRNRYFREYSRKEGETIQYLTGQPIVEILEVCTPDYAEVQKVWIENKDFEILWNRRGIEWIGDMPEVGEPYWISYTSTEHGDAVAHDIAYQIAEEIFNYWDQTILEYGMKVDEIQPIADISHQIGTDWGHFYTFAVKIRYVYKHQRFTPPSEGYPVERIDVSGSMPMEIGKDV
ncbi:MAG TPA: hypothetical protein EYP30_08920 [Archaeoglobaceae archaeon]|nr:hypothetical protein [Archaeoglobaceae archaeon]